MTEPTPPSIPPRARTSDAGDREPSSSRAATGAVTAWGPAQGEPTGSPEGALRPAAGAGRGRTASSANGRTTGSNGHTPAAPPAASAQQIFAGSAPNSPEGFQQEDAPAAQTRSSAAATDEDEPPTPLMAAVDTATVWVKKAASSTGAAIGSLTRPKPEEPDMTTSSASAPTAAPHATGPRPASGPVPRTATSARPTTGRVPVVGGPRRVRLAISRVDPWSVMKLSFLLSVAAGIMLVIAASATWFTLDGLHVFTKVNDFVVQVTGKESSVDILQYVAFKRILSGATLIAVIDVFLLTALATIGAFLYNIVAALVGGLHVTMTDE